MTAHPTMAVTSVGASASVSGTTYC
jgi:hypothetical protein